MSEYWKSTPSYWCKFCSQYVRDSPLERKNHDASGRHQNNISRSLRELHKGQERETREKQRAKDEVARLNGMFSDKPGGARDAAKPGGSMSRPAPAPANMNPAAQRKAHAEQLAAMGVALPEDLQKEVTGVGNFHVVSERAVEPSNPGIVTANRSLAEILAEAKREPSDVVGEQLEGTEEQVQSAPKRKLGEDEDEDEEGAPRRKAWGSNLKAYPGVKDAVEDDVDLAVLLKGVVPNKEPAVKTDGGESVIKQEEGSSASALLNTASDVGESSHIKSEPASEATPAVVFKKRKGKK